MDKGYSIIVNFIYCSIIIEIIIALIIFKFESARLIIINALTILAYFTPHFLQYNALLTVSEIPTLAVAALITYPFTFSFMMKNQFFFNNNRNILFTGILSLLSFVAYTLLPEYDIPILYILFLTFYVLIFYHIMRYRLNTSEGIYYLSIIAFIIYIIYGIYAGRMIHFMISGGIFNLVSFMVITVNYKLRVSDLLVQSTNLNQLNKKLTHTISRLRQSIEQYRRIIIEKDLEIFQLARHASLAELTTGIAHELSQPLTGIKGIAQNMIDDINYQEFEELQGVAELTRISQLVDKSSTIIDHIRNFSRKNVFTMKQVALNQTILDALELINIQMSKNNIDIVLLLDEALPFIFGDKISLEQLIVNMILNARDAIVEKSNEFQNYQGSIRISTMSEEDCVILKIEDNGIGIPGDIIEKIWSPFFTTKDRTHGTGIGLSISNKIIKEHNAKVNISSNTSGTIFTLHFPLRDEKLQEATQP